MNRYMNRERAAVKSVVVDLNAQYIKFIKELFPNARIIIDRFHIVQLVGRALGNARISLMKKMNDCHCRHTGVCFTRIPLTLKLPGRFIYGESMNT